MHTVTNHALERWCKRFPGHDLAECFSRSKRIPAAKVMGWKQANGHPLPKGLLGAEYHWDEITEALFIVSTRTGGLLTVYRLSRKKRR